MHKKRAMPPRVITKNITQGDPASMHAIKKKMDPRVKPEDDSKG